MAYILQSQTRAQIVQKIAALLNGLANHTITTGTVSAATSNTITVPRLIAMPQGGTDLYVGKEVYISGGTGIGQLAYVTTFDPTTGKLTVVPNWTITPDSTSTVALFSRFSKDQVDFALDTAFLDGASLMLLPADSVCLAFETTTPPNWNDLSARRPMRSEYPIPSQYLWLEQADYDQNNPLVGYGEQNWTPPTNWVIPPNGATLGQVFKNTGSGAINIKYASLYLANLTGATGTIAPILKDVNGTTIGTFNSRLAADIQAEPSLVVFELPTTVQLATGAQAQLTVQLPTGVHWAYDDTASYTGGTALINGNPDTTVSYLFFIYGPPDFKPFPHPNWSVVQSDEWPLIHFQEALIWPVDGTLIRLRGARAVKDFTLPAATDSSVPEIEPIFLVYKAAALLCTERLLSPSVTPDMIQQQAQLWAQMAEQHRRPFVLPQGKCAKVR